MKTEAIMSLDIGGTNCRIGLVDKDYRLYEEKILSTTELMERGFMEELVKLIKGYRKENEAAFSVKAVSLGFPSTIDRSRRKLISTPNIGGLDNLNLVDILEEELKLPVYLERDVNLLLIYDLYRHDLPTEATVIGIYFGTGIGNGIYLDGHLLYGRNGVAGELGHIPQLHSDALCGCGNHGCIEPIGGGRYLEELCETRFPGTEVQDIYKRHRDTAEVRKQVEAMAIPVATEVNILDPDYVILGGGLMNMENFPTERLVAAIHKYARKPYPEENLRLICSEVRQEDGIIGAGIYGWKKYNKQADVL